MPSPSKLPDDVKQYLEKPGRPPLPTPTQAFDDERTVAADVAPPTLDQLPNSATPTMGVAMIAPAAPQTAPELSTLAVTDSALISIDSQPHPSDAMDRTLAMLDAPPRVPPPAQPAFAGTLPLAAARPALPAAAAAPAAAPAPAYGAAFAATLPAPAQQPVYFQPPQQARAPEPVPLPMRDTGRTWLWLAIVVLAISLIGAGAAAAMLMQSR
jgi:hypothetical protein